MFTNMKKIASIGILAIFLGTMFVSLFYMSGGMDMEMQSGMADCPFMEHGEVICSMDFVSHIGAWKAAFTSVLPTIVTLVLVAGAVALFTSSPFLLPTRGKPIPIQFSVLRTRTYSYTYRPLQELFSNGILHPKLF